MIIYTFSRQLSKVGSWPIYVIAILLFSNLSTKLFATPHGNPPFAPPACTALFISEYVEGSSNNKCIEIYNPTNAAVSLTGYQLKLYFNGSTTVGATINLTGTVAAFDVFVVCNTAATAAFTGVADQLSGSLTFNGDDAVELVNGATTLDVVGQIGFDPGTEWGTGNTSTADNTIRRKAAIQTGDDIGNNAFDPAIEWDGFPIDEASGLGTHTSTCAAVCAISNVGLSGIACNDNGTSMMASDDYITFSLNPVGSGLGASYSVTVSSGTVTLANGNPATGVAYGAATGFRLQNGSAGAGNVTITVTDASGGTCFVTASITDPGSCAVGPTTCSELFISEYVEGSGNNKCIEIYNPTNATVSLTNYQLKLYFNGSATAGSTINLTGSIAAYGVHVICNTAATATFLGVSNQTSGSLTFNGDDAVELVKSGMTIDVLGQIGFDPGTEWGTGLVSTADNTIARKSAVQMGDAVGSNAFDPSAEWDGFATDYAAGLGSHTSACLVTCSVSASGITAVACNDNGTPSDPSDDYVTFSLNPTGTGLGAVYSVTVSAGTVTLANGSPATGVAYGAATAFRLQNGSAGGSNVMFTITDGATGTCQLTETITAPAACSSTCDLSDAGLSAVTCNNNGTTNTPTDDYITFSLNPTGVFLGATYSVNASPDTVRLANGNPAMGIAYGAPTDFRTQNGSAGGGTVMITIRDGSSGVCTITAAITAPGTCSTPTCDIAITNVAVVNETCAGANNGSITVTASCTSCTAIQYSIDGSTFQSGNAFVGLSPNTYTVYVRDASNFSCSANQPNNVIGAGDGTPPTFNGMLPASVTISCSDPVPPAATLTATDNVDPTPTVTFVTSTAAGTCPQESVITRTWTATDDCGNAATHTQTVTIEDNAAPTFMGALPVNVTLACNATLPAPPTITATDNCDPGVVPPTIFINEIHYDNTGNDVGEFVEVAGTAGIDLTQYQLVLYNGNGGAVYATQNLTGTIDNEGNGFGAVSFGYPANGVQNGAPDGVALIKLPSTVVQFLSYEGVFTATDGPAAGVTSTDIGVAEAGTEAPGLSLQLTGTGTLYNTFTWAGPVAQSPGTINAGQTINPGMGFIPVVYTQTMMAGTCGGNMTVKRMWSATDACGNNTSHMQTITLVDNTAPVFAPPLPADITISCETPVPAAATLVAVDACDNGSLQEVVWINEIHYDNVGTDVGEFIEVAGTAGTNLSQYQLVLYNGSGGVVYNTLTLSGVIDNESNGFGAVSFAYPVDGIQNGAPDGIALVRNGIVVQFLSYEGSFSAVGGPANGMTSTNIGVAEDGTNPVGTSVRLVGSGNKYADFTWAAPVAPSSAGSINAGQTFTTGTAGIPVTFNEVITPGTCPQERTIVRTWTATDGCGNAVTYTQTITVVDNTPPTVTCPPTIIPLNNDGMVTVTLANVPFSATDNCTPQALLVPTPTTVVFDCDDDGVSQPFLIQVTDQCGNVGVCTSQIYIPPYPLCDPIILISDPCVCKNNATTLTNGQFGETINIQALTGNTWTVIAVNGLYTTSSPNPPAAPTPLAIGTTFTEIPAGSGNYLLDGIHVDALGYSLTAQSNNGEILSIGNTCQYPNPSFTNVISGTFCANSPAVTLSGVPGDDNIAGETFTVNGVPATTFDPSILGPGTYNIVYTVDGGTPKASGDTDPGCIQSISQTVNIVVTPSTLSCNNLVQVSLDADCASMITPDMILDGSYGCYDDYEVVLAKLTGQQVPNPVTAANIGQTLKATVKHLVSGNTCWGRIKVEDKLPPVLDCANVTVSCAVTDYTPQALAGLGLVDAFPNQLPWLTANPATMTYNGNNTFTVAQPTAGLLENCTSVSLRYDDVFFDLACGNPAGMSAYVLRTWTATDASGNKGTCTQTIWFDAITVADVALPAQLDDISAPALTCDGNWDTNGNHYPDPSETGVPFVDVAGIQYLLYPGATFCEFSVAFADEKIPVCDGTYKIIRRWTLLDWCQPLIANVNPFFYTQVIKVADKTSPIVQCPGNQTTGMNPDDCLKDYDLPDVIVSDACSRIATVQAKYQIDGVWKSVFGTLTTFAGNNLWNPDTLAVFPVINDLPEGITNVQYIVTDDCGNSSTCAFTVKVEDNVQPVAICTEYTQVSLGADGMILVNATSFDQGSYDNCGEVYFKVRRMDPNACQNNGFFHDQVKFCCDDIQDTVTVILRVYDEVVDAGDVSIAYKEDKANDCMVQVFVDDKIKPICQAPAAVTVSCEAFDPSLWAYGTATATDNCCLDTITEARDYSRFDTLCNRGTITRTFRAFDCAGLSSTCSQRVFVNYNQDYHVRFPNDVIVTVCDGTGNYGEPTINKKDCELMAISYVDEIFTVVPDACYKIERTWTVINWCTYDPNQPCIYVPNPNPNAVANHPTNLPGPTVSPLGTPSPWAPTSVKISPTDPTATNYSTFWNKDANCYVYKQIIKVLDTQDPIVDGCTVNGCDLTANDANFWNTMDWYDNVTGQHDLCEAPVDICVTAADACSGTNINISALLFLDLDGDGAMETVVNSNNFPAMANSVASGTIMYNNYLNPSYTGGTAREYDHRPVANPDQQKYRFALQQTVANGKRTACIRWNTKGSPNTFVPVQLPYGKHKVKWFIADNCGNESVCESAFEVKDCKKPTVVCLNGLSVNIMQTKMVTLWASDFLQYGEDNCTPSDRLVYSIRKSGTGTGFPVDASGNPVTSLTWNCNELGTQYVELWAKDLAGNADFCETYVIVQDNMANCNADAFIAGNLKTEANNGLEDANVELSGTHPALPPFSMFQLTSSTGNFTFFNALPLGANYTVTPEKDNDPLNGVSTYDLLLISKHILGVQPLTTPYQMIAADVNKSGSITTYDIVELRKLILGIYNTLPANTSWRFVDADYAFPNQANPFQSQFPEVKTVAQLSTNQGNHDFVSIKVGDVNGNAVANNLMGADDRTTGTLLFDVEDRAVKAGETFTVNFKAAEKVLGYQFTMKYNNLEVAEIVPGAKMSTDNFAVFAADNMLTTSFDADAAGEFSVKFRATAAGKISNMIAVSSNITSAEAYTLNAERSNVAFRFNENGASTIAGVGFELYQNQPNPFVNKTVIGFNLPEANTATLTIFDETGRMLFTQKGDFAKGVNAISVDRALLNTTGLMYYKLETATNSATKKMIQTK